MYSNVTIDWQKCVDDCKCWSRDIIFTNKNVKTWGSSKYTCSMSQISLFVPFWLLSFPLPPRIINGHFIHAWLLEPYTGQDTAIFWSLSRLEPLPKSELFFSAMQCIFSFFLNVEWGVEGRTKSSITLSNVSITSKDSVENRKQVNDWHTVQTHW